MRHSGSPPTLPRRLLLGGAAAVAVAPPLAAQTGAPTVQGLSVMRCAEFLDTLGMNVHIAYTDSQYADIDFVLRSLSHLGIRHVRTASPDPLIDATWRGHFDKAARAGLHLNFLADRMVHPRRMVEVYRAFARDYPGAEFSIEGPNEVNNWPVEFDGKKGDEAAVAYQALLYRLLKNMPELRGRTVISATGMLVASDGDWTNYHSYPWHGEQPFATFEREQKKQTESMAGRPVSLTETGYYTLPNDTKAWGGVDEATQAKLLLNTYMDALRLGCVRTYLYQLLDAYPDPNGTDPEKHFGVFRIDGSAKPAAGAIRSLIEAMRDDAPTARTFVPTALAYGIESMPQDGASLLFSHSSGAHRLILWNQARLWDKDARRAVTPSPTRVQLRLGTRARRVEVIDPVRGPAPLRSPGNIDRLDIELAGSPVILRIS